MVVSFFIAIFVVEITNKRKTIMKEKDVVFKCCNAGGPLGAFSAQFINAKDIIEIFPTKIRGCNPELVIVYYDRELHSECSFFCDSIAIESNEK